MYIVVNADRKSWWRAGWLAEFLWLIDSYIPGTHNLSVELRVAYLSAIAAVCGLFLILFIQRMLLRILFRYKGWLYLNPGEVNRVTTIWAFFVKLLRGRKPLLYGFQAVIPRMSVPSLNQTIPKYLETVRPLYNDKEFEEVKKKAELFLKNEGPKLQRYLVLKSWWADNYFTDWWEKYVYLRGRSPIMINSNYYILDSLERPNCTQFARAAYLTQDFLTFREFLDTEEFEPQTIRDLVPLCMNQHRRIFNTTRIPGRECDTLEHHESHNSRHIAVLCNGRWYKLPIWNTKTKKRLGLLDLEQQYKWIYDDAHRQADSPTYFEAKIAALTAGDRTHWAMTREAFFSEGINKTSLDAIERAAFVVVLEDFESEDWIERGRSLFHGDGSNRWFDKSITLVVFKNSRSGVNCEHSWADAPVAAHMFEWCCFGHLFGEGFDEKGNLKQTPKALAEKSKNLAKPERLKWQLSSKAEEAIAHSLDQATKMIQNLSLNIICQDSYGKGFMKSKKMSPDAYIQMALQVAYYRDAGTFALTYEASMTRLFKHGRTETVRSLSLESVAFVKALEEKKPKKEVIELLIKAVDHHQNYYRQAMCGEGVDRHLFALYVVSQGVGVESPFLKQALSIPWSLSTSQQPQQQTNQWAEAKKRGILLSYSPGGGFGPVADDGYGVSYMLTDDYHIYFHISCNVSSPKTDAVRFSKHLQKAFEDMKALWD